MGWRIDISEITIGAENLAEVGEMCILIEKELIANSYTTRFFLYQPEIEISWQNSKESLLF